MIIYFATCEKKRHDGARFSMNLNDCLGGVVVI